MLRPSRGSAYGSSLAPEGPLPAAPGGLLAHNHLAALVARLVRAFVKQRLNRDRQQVSFLGPSPFDA
jgi:hypothetical protein